VLAGRHSGLRQGTGCSLTSPRALINCVSCMIKIKLHVRTASVWDSAMRLEKSLREFAVIWPVVPQTGNPGLLLARRRQVSIPE
jgi:hypothetical protein